MEGLTIPIIYIRAEIETILLVNRAVYGENIYLE